MIDLELLKKYEDMEFTLERAVTAERVWLNRIICADDASRERFVAAAREWCGMTRADTGQMTQYDRAFFALRDNYEANEVSRIVDEITLLRKRVAELEAIKL